MNLHISKKRDEEHADVDAIKSMLDLIKESKIRVSRCRSPSYGRGGGPGNTKSAYGSQSGSTAYVTENNTNNSTASVKNSLSSVADDQLCKGVYRNKLFTFATSTILGTPMMVRKRLYTHN